MAIINFDFYCGEDKYSDGAVEDYLSYLVENHIDINTLPKSEKSYPVFYHLSHLRENIINWYPIERHHSVLEIGAGCGAITRALCRKAAKVVSVDLSKRRAEINYQRNHDLDNLTIYVGNQNDIQFEEKFDYVILNGVFEYAMSFTDGPEPYRTFLKTVRSFAKKGGKLLIAIENRLGLKYFTGSAEDHTGNYFIGLNQYPDNNTVRTFSKSEWMNLLDSCNLKYKFYYPYPDYKFPVEIFTDKTLSLNGYGKKYHNLESNRYMWLREQELAKTFVDEGIIGSFSNSFFLEISEDENFTNIDYCKLSCDRKKDTRIITSILHDEEHSWIEKQAVNRQAIAHVEKIYKNSIAPLTTEIRNLPGNYENGKVAFPFLTKKTFRDEILSLLEQGNVELVKKEIKNFFEMYFSALKSEPFVPSAAFEEVFGSTELSEELTGVYSSNIDVIFENLYCGEDGCHIIDPEWVFDFSIPKSFVIWRAVHDFFHKDPHVRDYLQQEELLVYLGVDPMHADEFSRWNAHFVYKWLKAETVEEFVKPIHTTTMDYMVSLLRANTMLSCSLYYDCGAGYSEAMKLVAEVPMVDNCFSVVFDLSKIDNLRSLRFDPVEGTSIRCRVLSEHACLIPVNAWSKENELDVFITEDPIYDVVLKNLDETKHLHISGCVIPIGYKEKSELYIQDYIQKKEQEIQLYKTQSELSAQNYTMLINTQSQLQSTLQQTLDNYYAAQAELHSLQTRTVELEAQIAQQNSQSLQQQEIIDQQANRLQQQEEIIDLQISQIQEKQDEVNQQADQLNGQRTELEQDIMRINELEADLQKIYSSKGWKLLEFIRKIIKIFLR